MWLALALVAKIEEKMHMSSSRGEKRPQASDAVEKSRCVKAKAQAKMVVEKSEQVLGGGNEEKWERACVTW